MAKSKSDRPAAKPTPRTKEATKDLKKVELRVNEFGEIVRDVRTEDLNTFLNENVPDKKFTEL